MSPTEKILLLNDITSNNVSSFLKIVRKQTTSKLKI